MKYYKSKVTDEVIVKIKGVYRHEITVKDCLWTEKEWQKYGFNQHPNLFDVVEVPKMKTYFLFGARFALPE